MNRVKELKNIADKVNNIKKEKELKINEIVCEILEKARLRAEQGEYTLSVDEWCGDYSPLANEISKELLKSGFIVYTGAAYSYYIQWRH